MANLQIKYVPLFTLSIEQLFYSNKICRKYQVAPVLDLDLVPLAETRDLMQRMDLIFRPTDANGGLVVLARVQGENSGGDDLLRFPARVGDKLAFGLLLKNPWVLNQSDLPAQPPDGQAYYFSNETVDAAAPRNALPLSHDTGGASAADLLKFTASVYRYHAVMPVPEGSAVVRHLLTGKTVMPTSLINQAGAADITFDLAALPSGKCQLMIGGTAEETFYYTGSPFMQPLFAVAELILSPTLASNARIVEPDRSLTAERPAFRITFKNRKTTWRYTFQMHVSSPLYQEMAGLTSAEKTSFLSKLNIVSNDAAITFKQTNATDMAVIFESEAALLLQETYFAGAGPGTFLKLVLEKNIGDPGEAVVKDNLPYPSPELIDVTSSSVYSDIFITI